MSQPRRHFGEKSFPGREALEQAFNLCVEVGKTVTLQKVFNPELFPKNGSLRGLKRLSMEERTQMLADKMLRAWYIEPQSHEVDMLLKAGVDIEYIHPQAEGATLLGLAARRGLAHCAEGLLRQGADPDAKTADGMTPFQHAVWMGHGNVVELLLKRGADVTQRIQNGMTPLMLAVNGGGGGTDRGRTLDLLLSHGASLEDKDNGGRTAMDFYRRNYAFGTRSGEWAKPFLDASAALETRKRKEDATQRLMKAIRNTGTPGGSAPSPAALQRYIDDGADIERVEDELWKTTPLAILSTYNCVEPIKTLIAAGANVSPRHPERGSTPLTTAAYFGYVGLLNLLLDSGANVNEADNDGKTALMSAADRGCRREAAQLLIARGADAGAADKAGKTALDYCAEGLGGTGNYGGRSAHDVFAEMQQILLAAQYRDFLRSHTPDLPRVASDADFAEALLAAGLDPALKDAKGWTPLHWAASSGSQPLMESLLAKGADINAQDAAGRTPLIYAYLARNNGMAEGLLSHGALVDLKDARGRSAMDYVEGLRHGEKINGKQPADVLPQIRKELEERIREQFEAQFAKGARARLGISRQIRLNGPRKPADAP